MPVYRIASCGESDFHIVNHQYSDETVRYAASELQKYLLRSTGAVVPYFSDRCPMRGPEIRIGAGVRGETEAEASLGEEGFCIRAAGEHITITGGGSRGVLYGVYRFLELFCGFQCFCAGVETVRTCETLEITLEEIRETPAFEFRDAYFRRAFDGDFCAKNRLNSSLADLSVAKGGRMKWFNFHHSFRDLVPENTYFDTHPEYFSEIDGKRVRNSQLCLTNPEVLRIAERTLREWIVKNPECRVFSVAQNDNRNRCTCDACMRVEAEEGSPSGPIIRFVNQLADNIRTDHPGVILHTFAYQYSLPAPKKAVARDNVIVRLCSISCRFDRPFEVSAAENPSGEEAIFVNALRDWREHASRLYVWDYAVNFRNYLQPFLHLHTLAENIRFFRRIGIRGVLEQGNFAYGGGAAQDDLKSYLISKLLWDPDTDVDAAIGRYCESVYGARAGALIGEYIALAERAYEGHPLTIYQHPDAPWLSDDFVDRAEHLFRRAMTVAENARQREAIEREYLSVRFLRLSRMSLETEGREALIDAFFRDVKRFGLTEIRERTSLPVMRRSMTESRFAKAKNGEYSLYYIMQ
ncbi:MAG: DUF4838 domain-containing protein [Clostridia bacterium]|nr:DUF4838 domain-containing protein [Clostridia bacterium]